MIIILSDWKNKKLDSRIVKYILIVPLFHNGNTITTERGRGRRLDGGSGEGGGRLDRGRGGGGRLGGVGGR